MRHPGSSNTPTTEPTRRTPSGPARTRRGAHNRATAIAPGPEVAPRPLAAALTGGRATPAQEAQLLAMSPAERIAAMTDGRLSLTQLTAWSARRPSEVPLIGGEFAYIAMYDPEWCERAEGSRQ